MKYKLLIIIELLTCSEAQVSFLGNGDNNICLAQKLGKLAMIILTNTSLVLIMCNF